jgi:Protein of unknown function (DUF3716)
VQVQRSGLSLMEHSALTIFVEKRFQQSLTNSTASDFIALREILRISPTRKRGIILRQPDHQITFHQRFEITARRSCLAVEAATALQLRGTPASPPCERCKHGNGPFTECVILTELPQKGCANCAFNSRPCSLKVKSLALDSSIQGHEEISSGEDLEESMTRQTRRRYPSNNLLEATADLTPQEGMQIFGEGTIIQC